MTAGSNRCLYTASGDRRYLSTDERSAFARAANCADEQVRYLCLTLLFTGCRVSEALALRRAHVDATDGHITLKTLKKQGRLHVRAVPVCPSFARSLRRFALRQPEDQVLFPMHRMSAWRQVKDVMQAAGIAGIHATPRGLRHSFAVNAIMHDVPLHLVQRWMGHASMQTTAIYTNVVGREERQIAARMWRDAVAVTASL